MDFQAGLKQAIEGVDRAQVNQQFLSQAETLLQGIPDQPEVPANVVEDLTKWVETKLRSTVEEFLGHRMGEKARSGVGLVNAIQESGLLLDELARPEPVSQLLRWYVSERDAAHHAYPSYPWATFLAFFWGSNLILNEVERRRAKPRAVYMSLRVNPAEVRIGGFVSLAAQFLTPDTGASFTEGHFQVQLLFSNSHIRSAALDFDIKDQVWRKDIPTSGAATGDFTVVGVADGPQGKFISKPPGKGKIVEREEDQV